MSNALCGLPSMTATAATMPSSSYSVATAKVRSPSTLRSALTLSPDIASSAVAAAKKINVTTIIVIAISVVSAVSPVSVITIETVEPIVTTTTAAFHVTPASRQGNRQGRHQGEPKPKPDSVNRTVRLAHTDVPFAEEITKCGCSGNFTRRGVLANRISLSPRHAPQVRYAAVIESPNVKFIFGLVFIRHEYNPENLAIAIG